LKGLNQAQKEAVLHTKGPLLVLAGAGAGKTRVITHRILEIVRQGVAPEQVLAITFTNKAAGEMRERAFKLLRDDQTKPLAPRSLGGVGPFISTFHSLGLAIIKENARALGFKRTPVIYDRADSLRAIKEALKSLGTEEVEPRVVLSVISRQKGDGISLEEFAASAEYSRDRLIAAVWQKYTKTLAEEHALDFDDLLLRSTGFLRTNAEAREALRARFTYLHIDEYQDTNKVQAEMADLLVGEERNICAVGDIDQTIYGWRGAQIANILSFEKKFPGGRVILLEENYRSTKTILAAANDIISKNVFRREKNLYTKNPDGEPLSLYQAFDEVDEGAFVARKVRELVEEGAQPEDIAVLYRANFQSRAIEEALLTADIPYQVIGTRFFERKEIKDVLSFIRAALYETPPDIARVINIPARGLGKVTLAKVLMGKEETLPPATRAKVAQFRALLAKIKEAAERLPPSQLVLFVMQESGMEKMYKQDKLEGQERLLNVRELVGLAARHDSSTNSTSSPQASSGQAHPNIESTEKFLEAAALASDADEIKGEKNAVRLMTVHASKGLEFPYIFITGLEEGLFPYAREDEHEADKEEERRLMYVALTRAKKKIFLSYASYRTIFGSKNATLPSQFLTDISPALVVYEAPERMGKTIYLD
ncbi:MAG: UvrD-helicase domain-containing protein, partial [Patescibacteria group bacterium]|nr:UvrD-helicase domain-containing protein [Patescibacteria group bacterium]